MVDPSNMPPRQVLFALEPPVTDFASMNGKASEGFGAKILAASGLDQLGGTAAGQGQGDHYEGEVRNRGQSEPHLLGGFHRGAAYQTIAQKLDALSSQAKVAGHRAVVSKTSPFLDLQGSYILYQECY